VNGDKGAGGTAGRVHLDPCARGGKVTSTSASQSDSMLPPAMSVRRRQWSQASSDAGAAVRTVMLNVAGSASGSSARSFRSCQVDPELSQCSAVLQWAGAAEVDRRGLIACERGSLWPARHILCGGVTAQGSYTPRHYHHTIECRPRGTASSPQKHGEVVPSAGWISAQD
jgi:hypothetical protein